MGWRPDEVRAHSLDDFVAAREGWKRGRGAAPPPKRRDVERLDELMAQHPDRKPG